LQKKEVSKAFLLAGHTEHPLLLSYEGKKTVVETLRNSVGFSADIIVNVGSSSPVESIKLAKYTESVGAVAIASVHLFIILVDKATIEKIARSLDRVLWRAKHVD